MLELPEDLYAEIASLSEEGNGFIESEHYDEAILKFEEALNLVPNPQSDWEASTWLNASIGDCYFMKNNFKKSLNFFLDAYNGPDGVGNPFINLRIGESYFELEVSDKAREFLLRAYMLEGDDIFEEEDDKYLNHIKDLIQ